MIEAALIGAGRRGMFAYASYALKRPDEIKFVAVAEPDDERRALFAKLHGIPEDMQFSSWDELFNRPQLCEALLICTQDRQHYEPTLKALEKGYHILLEKPMSASPWEAIRMAEQAERFERILTVCHVSRYDTYYQTLKQLLDSGAIGKVMTVQWTENVGYWHHAHSFVRGNWRNSKLSSPMILQKCCHDMDVLQWLLNSECTHVSSFGKLSYFKEENAPAGSTARCTDGCAVEHECPFSAIKLYHNEKTSGFPTVVSLEPTLEARMKGLKEGPYGRCVYRCDNDVVDHQVVNLNFANGVTVAFTMTAFTTENTRTFKIMGTAGEIKGHHEKNEIEIKRFNGRSEVVKPQRAEGGHSGADYLIMRDFVKQVHDRDIQGKSSAQESARSHMIAFAAEHARIAGTMVDMKEYIHKVKNRIDLAPVHG